MAISSYRKTYPLESLTEDDFLLVAQEACRQLGWPVHQIDATGLLAYAPAGDHSVGDEIRLTLDDGNAYLHSESMTGKSDEERHRKNIERLIQVLASAKGQLSTLEMPRRASQIQDAVVEEENTRKGGFWSWFVPSEGFFVTPILMGLNILVFIAMAVSGVGIFEPENESLIRWGANFKLYTLDNGWWRLFTSTFLHIGIIHLLMNMYALMFIGLLLEPFLGKLRFLVAYVGTGILASVASLWWHDSTISAGASGAIFGMYGVFLAMLTTNHIEKEARKALLGSISIFVIYNLLSGLRGGVDNAAHIGGLLSGMLVGYMFYPSLKYPSKSLLSYASMAGIALVTTGIVLLALRYTSDPIGEYDRRMEDFYARQTAALRIYNMPEGTSNAKILVSIRDTGLVYWKENLKLVKELDQLDLPESVRSQNKKMMEYSELRVKSYELMYKAFKEDTDAYENQIQVYDKRIASLINEINKK